VILAQREKVVKPPKGAKKDSGPREELWPLDKVAKLGPLGRKGDPRRKKKGAQGHSDVCLKKDQTSKDPGQAVKRYEKGGDVDAGGNVKKTKEP